MTGEPDSPPEDEVTRSLWLIGFLIGAGVLVVLLIIGWILGWGWGWLYHQWFGYEWPSDKGNGPEAITELIVLGIITAIVIPPIRRWFLSKFHHMHERLEEVHATVIAHHDEAQEARAELHRKLDHVIKHSKDIPDLPPKGTE